MPQVSKRLNLQFIFYNEVGVYKEIKNNLHINANVINIFTSLLEGGKQEFLLIYHKDYSEFSELNRNISNQIFWESRIESEFSELYDEIYKYIRLILAKKPISTEERNSIVEAIQLIQQVYPLDEELQELISLVN